MKRVTVHLAVRDRRTGAVVRVPARAYQSATPGLAVRRLAEPGFVGKWGIDHIPSGKCLLGVQDTRQAALNRCARLGELGDWTSEDPQIHACNQHRQLGATDKACIRCADLGVVVSVGMPPAAAEGGGDR